MDDWRESYLDFMEYLDFTRERNYLYEQQDFLDIKKDYVTSRQNYNAKKQDYLARREDHLARRANYLATGEDFLPVERDFITTERQFLREEEDFLTMEGDFIAKAQKFDTRRRWFMAFRQQRLDKEVRSDFVPPRRRISEMNYDVFLSFNGKDVRHTLVADLYRSLSEAGLRVFLDSEKLKKGEIIWWGLERAIGSSAIRIPIFSQGYADSAWCLKEAAAMLSTEELIIPLFYGVDPTHVRYPQRKSSPYKKSFLKHYGHPDRHQKEEVDRWKDALDQICSRSGWTMASGEE